MVKVTVVDEKDAEASGQALYAHSEASASTDSLSSVGSDADGPESFLDRVSALVDIIPPSTRHSIATRVGNAAGFAKLGAKFAGNVVWVLTTSAILIALPLGLALEDEAKLVSQEREALEQQQGQQQMLAPAYPPPLEGIKPPGI
ncbi:mitochondrial outer membrane translocase complex, subunit Tom22 [Flagelloscypha sp. PMI_526]|nr:mitochondrial outer membrane translocase complex, subunit Tom22 [Flagelloscypha sp. PMI_526]